MSMTESEIAETTAANVDIWNRCAETYRHGFEALTGQATTTLLDLAGVGRGTKLLDVGTGPGTVLAEASVRGAQITAIDIAPEMLAVTQHRHPTVTTHIADAHQMPFADASFDAVTIGFCLHHTADPRRVLHQARRVLRSGGRIAFTVWDEPDRLEAFGLGFSAFADELPTADDDAPPPLGEQPSDYEELLAEIGFNTPTARVLDLTWPITDASSLYDGFARYFGLQELAPERATIVRTRLDDAVTARLDTFGIARLPNPAVVAAAQRPT